jgi:cyanophycinase
MKVKGKLVIIGGAEDRVDEHEQEAEKNNKQLNRFKILKELLPADQMDKKIEVVTTASSEPDEMETMYQDTFNAIGYKNIGFLHIKDRFEAAQEANCARIKNAAVVFFTGGDQFRLTTILEGTPFFDIIKDKYQHDTCFTVAGTSAGAMAMSQIMICGGGTGQTKVDDDLQTSTGLGLLQNCIIDTHFIERGRYSRLSHAVVTHPACLGIGLGEDTALIIHQGIDATCRGSGMVVIIDGKNIEQSTTSEAKKHVPLFVENLKVHLISDDCSINLLTRKLKAPYETVQ